ncbi:MAG TPA: YigZ family protein [Ignavibacteriaceae bacterium]|nr:YigZ family protein [Ignavibacteriaceae bacterium]
MNYVAEIRTIGKTVEFEFKEKSSGFLAILFPIQNEDDFKNSLLKIKKKYFDATHHCYAYRLHDGSFKYSDDGEPGGTAGVRIHNALTHFGVTDAAIIVVRYFGGTKLGVGPLGKAYYHAAFSVVEKSSLITKYAYKKFIFTVDFTDMNIVHKIIDDYSGKLLTTNYSEKVSFEVLFKKSDQLKIESKLKEYSESTLIYSVTQEVEFL